MLRQSVRMLWEGIPADRIYLILLLIFGVICLTVTGGWRIYTDSLTDGGRLLGFLGNLEDGQEDISDDILANKQSLNPQHSYGMAGTDVSQRDGDIHGGETQSDEENLKFHYEAVEDEYFADAVFIGDSRTVGLYEYGELQDISTFYASTGLTVHKLFTAEIVEVPGQRQKITVEEALSGRQFAKIYFMIGINEMGTGTVESFLRAYGESIAHLKELQPDAVIYLQGIMRVTTERSEQGDYITNEGIDIRNEGIAELADNETIFYLDVNEAVCDENGAMISDYTYDGVHLKARYIALWKDYLKNHAVIYE